MAYVITDRRLNGKGKSSNNRQKFMRRVKKQITRSVKKAIANGKITDVIGGDQSINIPVKDLTEPTIHHGTGGIGDAVHPGNDQFSTGDRIARPPKGGGKGKGGEGSNEGEGEDDFHFTITKDEFLDIFFEDLELPDMLKRQMATTETFENKRAGFSTDGNPAQLNVAQTMRSSKGRRIGLRSPKKRKIKELEMERDELNIAVAKSGADTVAITLRIAEIDKEIEVLKRKIKAIPFVDDMDLRFNRWEKVPAPTTQAVMFCIMDVSGSMGEWEKEMSKRFFMLLYLFLTKKYKKVDLVFIRHHISAKEVDEDEFFHSRETGGTIVSPALELVDTIAKERYPTSSWNLYVTQCSDGDNWPGDTDATMDLMKSSILSNVQYFAYVEIEPDYRRGGESDLWPHYSELCDSYGNFNMVKISDAADIYPVFRGLFEQT